MDINKLWADTVLAARNEGMRLEQAMVDPMTEDERVHEVLAVEDEREARWSDFVEHLKQANPAVVLRHLADLMEGKDDWNYRVAYEPLEAFRETEGYAGILAAMSRALREQEAGR